jgi:hypothetical protein
MQRRDDLGRRLRLLIPSRIALVQERVQIDIIIENLGTDEVEQREEFPEVVLERRAGYEHPASGDISPDDLGEEGVEVLDTMSFVDDDLSKGELFQGGLFADADLVGGD